MLVLSAHALKMLVERGIERAWVERTIMAADAFEPDPVHPDRIRAFRAVPEREGRVLRVVYAMESGDVRIVTAFLDRSRRERP